MKTGNNRCPLQTECERRCTYMGHELDCDYYSNNAWGDHVIEDQEEIRNRRERMEMEEEWERQIAELPEEETTAVQERGIDIITEEILFYKRQAGGAIIEIGRRLNEAKNRLEHGEWLPWLREKIDLSERSAQNFMRLAKEYDKSAEIADLGASKALALLALPASEREEFAAEKHKVNGQEKTVRDMTAAELKQAIRERDEARKRVRELEDSMDEQQRTYDVDVETARAEADAAEQARAKMAEDMKLLKERLDGLNGEIQAKAEQTMALERELKELRERPIDVAVQEADPAELEKAREEGAQAARAELTKQLEKAKSDLDVAASAREKAQTALKELTDKLKATEQAVKAAQAETERAKKAAQTSGNADVAEFKVYFSSVQDGVNKLVALLTKLDGEGRTEEAGKLRQAMGALAGAIQSAAEK